MDKKITTNKNKRKLAQEGEGYGDTEGVQHPELKDCGKRIKTGGLEGNTGFILKSINTYQDCPSNLGQGGQDLGHVGGARSAGAGKGVVGQTVSAQEACAAVLGWPRLKGGRYGLQETADIIGQLAEASPRSTNGRKADSQHRGSRLFSGASHSTELN